MTDQYPESEPGTPDAATGDAASWGEPGGPSPSEPSPGAPGEAPSFWSAAAVPPPPPPHDAADELDTAGVPPTPPASAATSPTPPGPWWAVTAGSPQPVVGAPEQPAPAAPAAPVLGGHRTRSVVAATLISALVGGLIGGGIVSLRDDHHTTTTNATPTLDASTRDTLPATPLSGRGDAGSSVRAILAKVQPGVVRINVTLSGTGAFGETGQGGGTGFIVSSDGYIVTNAHVVDGATDIKVTLENGDVVSATVKGVAADRDLAVIKVARTGLTPVVLGDSDAMQVGDPVVAIGNALDLEGQLSVTTGIVSAENRQIQEQNGNTLVDVIQTDASINPGNSGGPLVNARGEVIGINTAIASPQDSNNVGFAIAISSAKPIIDALENGRSPAVPYLGITPTDVTPDLAAAHHLSAATGAYVQSLHTDGPAGSAGIKQGDVIITFDGQSVTSAASLRTLIRRHQPGDKVQVVVSRGGSNQTFTVTLVPLPANG